MRFGDKGLGNNDGSGILTRRNGRLNGYFCPGKQGDYAVQAKAVNEWKKLPKSIRQRIRTIADTLSQTFGKDIQVEFTIEGNEIYILQVRDFKTSPGNHFRFETLEIAPAHALPDSRDIITRGKLIFPRDLEEIEKSSGIVLLHSWDVYEEYLEQLLKCMYQGKIKAMILYDLPLNFNSHFNTILECLGIKVISVQRANIADALGRNIYITDKGSIFISKAAVAENLKNPVSLSPEEMRSIEQDMQKKREEALRIRNPNEILVKLRQEYHDYSLSVLSSAGQRKLQLDYQRHLLHNIIKEVDSKYYKNMNGLAILIPKLQDFIASAWRQVYYKVLKKEDEALSLPVNDSGYRRELSTAAQYAEFVLTVEGTEYSEEKWQGYPLYYTAVENSKLPEISPLLIKFPELRLNVVKRTYSLAGVEDHNHFGPRYYKKRAEYLDREIYFLISPNYDLLVKIAKRLSGHG